MPIKRSAFTLIELLVVVAIIALLISILLPSLGSARAIARATRCSAQMHSVGQAVAGYNAENDNAFPASYLYPDAQNQVNAYAQPIGHPYGYQHWSYYLFNQVRDLTAFTCPEFERGGVPRTNPGPDARNWMSGQIDQNGGTGPTPTSITDNQAPFMAFTANAALIPRNKFTAAIAVSEPDGGSGQRLNMYVKRTTLTTGESATILLTEFNTNWRTIAEQQGSGFLAKGHRPVNPFYSLGSGTNEYLSAPNAFFTNVSPNSLDDLATLNNASAANASLIIDASTILNAVGRNHPGSTSFNGKSYGGTSNFLYVDGHTERKNVVDTLAHREWGDRYYSINGDNSVR